MQDALRTFDHLVQFYSTDAFLGQSVTSFLANSLRQGTPSVAICTAEHRAVFSASLRRRGFDVERLAQRGKLTWLDAKHVLSKLRPREKVAARAFGREVGELVADLCASSPGAPVRVYGELVDLLWTHGEEHDALRLEAFWEALAAQHSFSLLCAYRLPPEGGARVPQICAAHSHVLRAQTGQHSSAIKEIEATPVMPGERRLVEARRRRDRLLADSLREDLAQGVFGSLLQANALKAVLPPSAGAHLEDLMGSLQRALRLSLLAADELDPVQMQGASFTESVKRLAAAVEHDLNVDCDCRVSSGFRDPDRGPSELLYSILFELVGRAVIAKDARRIGIRLARYQERCQVFVSHDGDADVLLGAVDDGLRRLLYEAHALGYSVEFRPGLRGGGKFSCSWFGT